jgi:predicted nuclease with RNAse H fold
MKIIGIDLAGKPTNPTGICILANNKTEAKIVYSDAEIIEIVESEKPDVIAIDAPFNFPKTGWWRDSDRALINAGFRPLSPKFPGMKVLVERAQNLIKKLSHFKIIEVFPRATEKRLGLKPQPHINAHKYDALLCALTGKAFLENKYEMLGKERIILPL